MKRFYLFSIKTAFTGIEYFNYEVHLVMAFGIKHLLG